MKKIIMGLIIVMILIGSLVFVSALTASIGNSRMVLKVAPGDTVEKYILVRNTNDVPVTIKLDPNGDLADDVELVESIFELDVGEERKAEFSIEVKEMGTSETKINVGFSAENKTSVGLSSTIIIFSDEKYAVESEDKGFFENLFDEDAEDEEFFEELDGEIEDEVIDNSKEKEPRNNIGLLLAVSFLLICVLIVMYFFALYKKNNSDKPQKKVKNNNA
jgi:hypothetical protein